jgi:formylglycine-generating enzyme required for sulfatase activity
MSSPSDLFRLCGSEVAGKYRVDEVIGENAQAVVYRALRHATGAIVALRVFKVLGEFSVDQRELFLQNLISAAVAASDLSGETEVVCAALEIGPLTLPDGHWVPYLAYEWLPGMSLRRMREEEQRAGLPPRALPEALALLEPAAMALARAHRRGLVHAGLTPSVIVVLGNPRRPPATLRLLDFGVTRAMGDARAGAASGQTSRGTFAFTPASYHPAFAAPEQLEHGGHPVTPATDVFSFALVVAYLLAYPTFDATRPTGARADALLRTTPGGRGVAVSHEIEAVFARALARDPTLRQPNLGELWNELRMALGLEGAAGPPSIPMGPPSARGSQPGTVPMGVAATQPASFRGAMLGNESLVALAPGTSADETIQRPVLSTHEPKGRGASLVVFFFLLLVLSAGAVGAVMWWRMRQASPVAAAASATASASAAASTPPPTEPCKPKMAFVPAGQFFMGSDDKDARDDEKPAHNVRLAAYCIDLYEVTVAEYATCSDRGACKRASRNNEWAEITPKQRATYDPLCNIRDPEGLANHPINCVSWEMADIYCRAQDKRLPTEAEWEYATRGSDGRVYPWGDDDPDPRRLNACGTECTSWGVKNRETMTAMYQEDDGWPTTAPVGSFPLGRSRFGLYDVVGNVWEWVGDWYGPYVEGAEVDPRGPTDGEARVIRGGAWNGSFPAWVRPSFRYRNTATTLSYGIGFRCASKPLATP